MSRSPVVAATVLLALTPLGPATAQRAADPVSIGAPAPAVIAPQPGMPVLSAEGDKVGTVESVNGTPDGAITAVNVTAGGFLGFGAKLVAIPQGRFSVVDRIVRVELTAEEVSKLPHQGP